MECKCDSEEAATGWVTSGNLQMGAFTVVGYLLYRFSQTLPALVRWPIRIFCSITGLSTLWSWVSRLVGTLRVIKTLYKYLNQFWHFLVRISSKFNWLSRIIRAVTGSREDDLSQLLGLRIVLLRPCDDRSSSLVDFLLGPAPASDSSPEKPLLQSSRRTIALKVGEVTIIDAPVLPGLTLENRSRAREALRSLQLSSPGPHAFFIETPVLNTELQLDLSRGTRAAVELFGAEVAEHVVPVVTHKDHISRRRLEQLLRPPPGNRSAPELRPELLNVSAERSADDLNAARVQLLRRAAALKNHRGRFIHELQRREDQAREELLRDMSRALELQLGQAL